MLVLGWPEIKLKLNGGKEEPLVLIARHITQLPLERLLVCGDNISSISKARNIVVTMDSSLFMEHYINNICNSGLFHHLRNIGKIRGYLSPRSAETLVYVFATFRLNFCNSVLKGL